MPSNSFRVASGLIIEDPNNPGSILFSIDSSNNIINSPSIISINASTDAFRISQTGSGNALVVEDTVTPDASPFIVDSNGRLSVGNRNNLINFPNASMVAANTNSGIQIFESHNIGIMGEGTGNSSNTSIHGIGVFGTGYTASGTKSGGIIGRGRVSASSDSGMASGVRGHATDTHSGGLNIGIFGEAFGSSIGNYSFYSNTAIGTNNYNLYVEGSAPNYFAGKVGIGGSPTSNNLINFPNALVVVSNTATGIQVNENHNIGIMGEGTANSSNTLIYGVGVYGAGYTASATRSGGVIGEGHVSSSSDTGSAIGVRGYANDTHSGGLNIGVFGEASGSNTGNYAFYSNSATGANTYNLYIAGSALNYLGGDICISGVISTNAAAPTIAASSTIAPTKMITFISGTAAPIANITPPSTIVSCGGGQITLLPTAAWTTNTAGNIALSSTAVVSKALIMTWDGITNKWYPSY